MAKTKSGTGWRVSLPGKVVDALGGEIPEGVVITGHKPVGRGRTVFFRGEGIASLARLSAALEEPARDWDSQITYQAARRARGVIQRHLSAMNREARGLI